MFEAKPTGSEGWGGGGGVSKGAVHSVKFALGVVALLLCLKIPDSQDVCNTRPVGSIFFTVSFLTRLSLGTKIYSCSPIIKPLPAKWFSKVYWEGYWARVLTAMMFKKS